MRNKPARGARGKGAQGKVSQESEFETDVQRVPLTAVSSCVWLCSPGLIMAVHERLGDPVDAYVNGSQVWIDDDGPDGVAIEWRLHPVPSFERPKGLTTSSMFVTIASALMNPSQPVIAPSEIWDGLEAFPAYHDDIEPEALAKWVAAKLHLEPLHVGRVNHDDIADRWEASNRSISIVGELISALTAKRVD